MQIYKVIYEIITSDKKKNVNLFEQLNKNYDLIFNNNTNFDTCSSN